MEKKTTHQNRELSGGRRDEHGEREINPPKSGRGFSERGGKTATTAPVPPFTNTQIKSK